MKRFKDPEKQRRYAVYINNAETMRRNINSADRRLFWFARYGANIKKLCAPGTYGYPIARAGADLFKENGAPDFDVMSRFCSVRDAVAAINGVKS